MLRKGLGFDEACQALFRQIFVVLVKEDDVRRAEEFELFQQCLFLVPIRPRWEREKGWYRVDFGNWLGRFGASAEKLGYLKDRHAVNFV